jgi:hypothetical protein
MRTQEPAQGEAGRRGLRASGRGITWSYAGSCKWTSENFYSTHFVNKVASAALAFTGWLVLLEVAASL